MTGVPKTARPTILYKYCPPERIDILDNLRVHFSPPSGFNDVFDSDDPVQRDGLFEEIVLRQKRRDGLGVLCLTEVDDNHLMWVHYAKGHTGFVLGFNSNAPFFEQGVLDRVIYERKPDEIPNERACFYKSKDWGMKQNGGAFASLRSQNPELAAIEPELITRVVFGWKMEQSSIFRIIRALTAWAMSPAIFRSNPDRRPQTFVNQPVKVTRCQHCAGKGYQLTPR